MTSPTRTDPALPDTDDYAETLEEATGSDNPDVQRWLLDRISGLDQHTSPFDTESGAARERRLAETMRGIRTGELTGGILASEMIAAHTAACDCIRRLSAPNQPPAATLRNTRDAHNLMWIVTRQAAVLDHYRPKNADTDRPHRIEIGWLDALPVDDPMRVAHRERHAIPHPSAARRDDAEDGPARDPESGDGPV